MWRTHLFCVYTPTLLPRGLKFAYVYRAHRGDKVSEFQPPGTFLSVKGHLFSASMRPTMDVLKTHIDQGPFLQRFDLGS